MVALEPVPGAFLEPFLVFDNHVIFIIQTTGLAIKCIIFSKCIVKSKKSEGLILGRRTFFWPMVRLNVMRRFL